MKLSILVCIAMVVAAFAGPGARSAWGQTTPSGQPISVATPTPVPVGTASTALASSLTGGGVANGEGSMGTGVHVPPASAVPPIVPGAITISSFGSSAGAGNVAGSVQINNGGPGSVTGTPVTVSPIPTYVTPGTGLGTTVNAGTTAPNPNPGSVQ